MRPKVSIIVPNYNHAKYLPKRLESITQQTYQNFEVILLDDCSTDSSLEILKAFSEKPFVNALIINPKNSGSTFKQWHKGISACSADYVWIAESDDIALPTYLEEMVELLDNNNEAICAVCEIEEIDADGHTIRNDINKALFSNENQMLDKKVMSGKEFVKANLSESNLLRNVSAMLFKREAFNYLDDEVLDCKYVGDWLFYLKVLCKHSIAQSTNVLCQQRKHQQSTRFKRSINEWRFYVSEAKRVQNLLLNEFTPDDNSKECFYRNNLAMIEEMLSAESTLRKVASHSRYIAIYGASNLAILLHQLIHEEFQIKDLDIKYIIDRNAHDIQDLGIDTTVLAPEDYIDLEANLPIYISSRKHYQSIYRELEKCHLEKFIIN